VIGNNIYECTDRLRAEFSSGMTSQLVRVGSARVVGWGRNEKLAFLYLMPYISGLMYNMQAQCSQTFLINTTDHILHSHSRYCLLPLLLLRSVSILSACCIINVRVGHKDTKLC
jgi:hypothetical protein